MLDKIANFSRNVTRPWLTKIGFGTLVVAVLLQIEVPAWFQTMVSMMIAFWFGQRKPSS
jgi:hypothetical protein